MPFNSTTYSYLTNAISIERCGVDICNSGIEGFANAGACLVPGLPESCPPERAAVPILQPILSGVCVEIAAEPDTYGNTRYTFEALNGVVFTEMTVPGETPQ